MTPLFSDGVRPTRFLELGYRCDGRSLWRVYDISEPGRPAAVGPHYASRNELLADLGRYASEYGATVKP